MGRALRGIPMFEVYDGFRFLDDGCSVSPSCLACPLPQCRYDDPAWWRQMKREWHDTEACAAYEANGRNATKTATELQVSRTTIRRRTKAIK